MVRLVQYGKIIKMMRDFEGAQISPLERNMMRGLFIRKIKDFAEISRKTAKMSLYDRFVEKAELHLEEE